MIAFLLVSLSVISSVDASWGSFFTGLSAYFSSSPSSQVDVPPPLEIDSKESIAHAVDLVDWSLVQKDERISAKDKCFVMDKRELTGDELKIMFPQASSSNTAAAILVVALAEKDESCLVIHTVFADAGTSADSSRFVVEHAGKWVTGELADCSLAIKAPAVVADACSNDVKIALGRVKNAVALASHKASKQQQQQ